MPQAGISYHPDPEINSEIAKEVLEGERVDLAAGLQPRWWMCPGCGKSHNRGHFGTIGSHRCLACGYVGSGGIMSADQITEVIVTRWHHPEGPSDLILYGTPDSTRETAMEAGYFGDCQRPELLTGTQEKWRPERFAALGEFEG